MRRRAIGVVLALGMTVLGCGAPRAGQPAATENADPGNRAELKALEAKEATSPKEAVAELETYIVKYPNDPKGYHQLAGAIFKTVPIINMEYTDADRALLERAAQMERRTAELSKDDSLRAAAYMGLTRVYGTLMLKRPDQVVEPAQRLIAMSVWLADPYYNLSEALVLLNRQDEAVRVWSDAASTLRGRHRLAIAAGIDHLCSLYASHLSPAQMQTLISMLNTAASDPDDPDPRARAVMLELQAHYLESSPARKQALLREAAPWRELADRASQASLEELKAMVDELRRRGAAR
jgi:hypothetical protein